MGECGEMGKLAALEIPLEVARRGERSATHGGGSGELQDRAHRRLKVHDVFQRQFFGRMNVAVQNGLEQIGVF